MRTGSLSKMVVHPRSARWIAAAPNTPPPITFMRPPSFAAVPHRDRGAGSIGQGEVIESLATTPEHVGTDVMLGR
jgi:hypothetical protein